MPYLLTVWYTSLARIDMAFFYRTGSSEFIDFIGQFTIPELFLFEGSIDLDGTLLERAMTLHGRQSDLYWGSDCSVLLTVLEHRYTVILAANLFCKRFYTYYKIETTFIETQSGELFADSVRLIAAVYWGVVLMLGDLIGA